MTDPMQAFEQAIEDAVEKVLAVHREAVEKACEQALQSGDCGVLQVNEPDGSISLAVTRFVPYGRLYIVRREYLDAFLARGRQE
jgi:hypothetical protein